jgi:hypothetical protein
VARRERIFAFVSSANLRRTGASWLKAIHAELRREAETWCCFVHPLFVNAKGCSTKLATALGWRLPVATTTIGARGYSWDENLIPLATSPDHLADMVLAHADGSRFDAGRTATDLVLRLAPTIDAVGAKLHTFLAT